MRRFVAIFAFLALFAAAPAGARAASWTIMVYLDADNNLESDGIDDFLEMAAVGSTAEVNIVVQFDRIGGYDDRYGNWTGCKRFLVTKGMEPTAAAQVNDLGEVNMGNPSTLEQFVSWAAGAYPADNYAVVLWNHGSGWLPLRAALLEAVESAATDAELASALEALAVFDRARHPLKAVCYDDTSYDSLNMAEVRDALERGAPAGLTLIGFDACLMGMAEVAYELKDLAQVMVGSEETEPNTGWRYDLFLGGLTADPSWTAARLGEEIVAAYRLANETVWTDVTQSAVDLSVMGALAGSVATLADALRASWNTDQEAVRTAATATAAVLDQAVIAEWHGAARGGSHGLAVFFPERYGDPDYKASVLRWAADTTWDEFLADYLADMRSSWVGLARGRTQEYDEPDNADLGDFLDSLIEPPPVDPNLLVNASFELGDARAAAGWRGVKIAARDGRTSRFSANGDFSFRLSGGASRKVVQDVAISGLAGEAFVLEAWSMARLAAKGLKYCRVEVILIRADGSKERHGTGFPGGSHGWMYQRLPFTAGTDFTRAVVRLRYLGPTGRVWFDDVSLERAAP